MNVCVCVFRYIARILVNCVIIKIKRKKTSPNLEIMKMK